MSKRTVSGITLTLLLIGMLTLAFNIQPVKASGTIYIRADGSVDPDTTPISTVDNITYTFTDNIYDEIVVERDNIVVDGAGYTLQGTGIGYGFSLFSTNNVTIKNVEVTNFRYGIWLESSSDNVLADNTVHSNNWAGVQLSSSSNHNTVSRNNITNNNQDGSAFYSSSFNTVSGNNITNHNRDGVAFYSSSNNNTVSINNITNSDIGVRFDLSSFNTVSGNNIINNGYGVFLWSSNHKIYHNNFINNMNQAGSFEPNAWDGGYPSGGNYWSDYTGVDSEGDGIGDTPYIIDGSNQDRYPLMNPWGTGTPVANFTWTPSIPKVGESVTFDASSSTPIGGEIVSYEWNFGDDHYDSREMVSHIYTSSGTYTVTLNVTDSEGLWDVEQKQIRVVQPHGPEAEFTATPDTASIGESIKFDASASLPGWNGTHKMPITEYRWDFGGAIKITTSTPIFYYSFISPGTYYATLTVYAPGATPEKTLPLLKEKGLRIGVITNGLQSDVDAILPKAGLQDFFDTVVVIDTLRKMKPDEEVFHYALKKLNTTPSRAIFVGDEIEADYKGAQKSGLTPYLIDRDDKTHDQSLNKITSLDDLFKLNIIK